MSRTFIALLRGINVSGTNKLPMKQLVSIAEALGLKNCRTYIQSGNLVFDAEVTDVASLEYELASAIEVECGFTPPVMIRTREEWAALVSDNPYAEAAEADPKSVHLFLLAHEPDGARLNDLRSRDFGSDRWHVAHRSMYLHLPNGLGRSKLATSIERILKVPMTARNWQSVLKIGELAGL